MQFTLLTFLVAVKAAPIIITRVHTAAAVTEWVTNTNTVTTVEATTVNGPPPNQAGANPDPEPTTPAQINTPAVPTSTLSTGPATTLSTVNQAPAPEPTTSTPAPAPVTTSTPAPAPAPATSSPAPAPEPTTSSPAPAPEPSTSPAQAGPSLPNVPTIPASEILPTTSTPTTPPAPTTSSAPTTSTDPTTSSSSTPIVTPTTSSSSSSSSLPTSTPSSSSPQPTLGDFEQEILNTHNEKRALHGVQSLTWDDSLAAYSANYANTKFSCDNVQLIHSQGPYGENLAAGYVGGADPVIAWYDEISMYNYNNPGFSEATGHFTQLVWKSTSKVGCARVMCNNEWRQYTICEYSDQRGNIVGTDPATGKDFFEENVVRPLK